MFLPKGSEYLLSPLTLDITIGAQDFLHQWKDKGVVVIQEMNLMTKWNKCSSSRVVPGTLSQPDLGTFLRAVQPGFGLI